MTLSKFSVLSSLEVLYGGIKYLCTPWDFFFSISPLRAISDRVLPNLLT